LKAVENQLQIASKRIRAIMDVYNNEKPKKNAPFSNFGMLSNIF